MRRLRAWALRLGGLFDKERRERELTEEIDSHIQMHVDDNVRAGMGPEDARRDALLRLGGVETTKERYRDRRGVPLLETLIQDVGFAVRTLRKNPGFTAVAILTLALGIGANTAIFSVVHAVLIEPLPYPQPERLVMIWENVDLPTYHNDRNAPAPGNFAEWRRQSTVFEGMAAIRSSVSTLTGGDEPLRLQGQAVSSSFFSVLGVRPALGRVFDEGEDRSGGNKVVVLGHALWIERFGADQGIIGGSILLDGESHTVLGVMPPGFRFPDPDDVYWVPIALRPAELANFGSHYLRGVVARLKAGTTLSEAQSELTVVADRLSRQYPSTNTKVSARVLALRDEVVGDVRPVLLVLLVAVGLVLLIVCANVASLLLAQASARRKELATRMALGASGPRIVRQLLTESALLALLGDLFGLALGFWGIRGLPLITPPNLPRMSEIELNGPVLAFSLTISMVAALAFGLAPALQATRGNVRASLKDEGRSLVAGSRLRVRQVLVVIETALGVVVLVASGLLVRSFVRLERTALGFETQERLTFRVVLPDGRYPRLSDRLNFYQRAFEQIEALPGVRSAAAVTFLPLTSSAGRKGFFIEDQPPPEAGQIPMTAYQVVTPGYFKTLGIPMLEGRDCAWSDTTESLPVVLVNRAMARAFWASGGALGRRLKLGPTDPWLTIVGVVGDSRQYDVQSAPRPVMYLPLLQQYQESPRWVRDWVVRTAIEPQAVASAVRGAIWRADAQLAITRLQTMERVRSNAVAPERFNLLLLGSFACLALILAAVGLYGVAASSVAQRRKELAIRLALGARRGDILKTVLGEGVKLAILGVAIGVAAALGVTQLMASLLYGIGARDPLTFAAVSLLLTVVALLACYVPARRALRVDPLVALRCE